MNLVTSLSEYLDQVTEIYDEIESNRNGKSAKALFFRGHSKTSYQLLPSALRKGNERTERIHLLNYRDNIPRHGPPYHFIRQRPEILADMQHYGLNTRLLDWTFSPLTALYFALRHCSDNENSEVIALNPWEYHHRFFDESTTRSSSAHEMHVLARALLPTHKVAEIENILKAEFYGDSLRKEDIELPFPFVAKYGNQRLVRQSGCFTIHGSADVGVGPHTALDCHHQVVGNPLLIRKIQISKTNRERILRDLNRLFVNDYSIYPDLEGMKQNLNDQDSLYSVGKKIRIL